jgi:predicted kinase
MPGSRCQPANGWLVLVAGWPGSGKSTLAAALAAELGLPLLAKDEIKEAPWKTRAGQEQQPPPSASAGPPCRPC